MSSYVDKLEKKLTLLRNAQFAVKQLEDNYLGKVQFYEDFNNHLIEEINWILERIQKAKQYMID